MSLYMGIVVRYMYRLQYQLVSVGISISLYGYSGYASCASKPRMSYRLCLSLTLIIFLLRSYISLICKVLDN
jgi:hypothetical protein